MAFMKSCFDDNQLYDADVDADDDADVDANDDTDDDADAKVVWWVSRKGATLNW